MKHVKQIFAFVLLIFVILIVTAPIIGLLFGSFSPQQFIGYSREGFPSIYWYQKLLSNTTIGNSIIESIFIGLSTSSLSIGMGFPTGYHLGRAASRNRNSLLAIFSSPAIIPYLLYAFSFGVFAKWIGIQRTTLAVVIGHTTVLCPLSIVVFYNIFRRLDEGIELCAKEFGANQLALFLLLFEMMLPSVIGCFFITFVLSWDEYIIAWFVSGFEKPYSVLVKTIMESTWDPQVFAVGSLIAILNFTLLLIALLVNKNYFFRGSN